jgi:hypothetical protein
MQPVKSSLRHAFFVDSFPGSLLFGLRAKSFPLGDETDLC